jgi:hypothetical protein
MLDASTLHYVASVGGAGEGVVAESTLAETAVPEGAMAEGTARAMALPV